MKRTLIVVDMQNDFVYGPLGTKEAQAIIPKIKAKIEEYVKNEDIVIFTQDEHDEDYLETQEGKNLPVPHCLKGTKGWEVIPELDIPQECIFPNPIKYLHLTKPHFGYSNWGGSSAFFGVNKECSRKDIEIELVGVCSDICVITNALSLKTDYPETHIIVDASCCAGTTPEKHLAALEVMKSCQIDVINE